MCIIYSYTCTIKHSAKLTELAEPTHAHVAHVQNHSQTQPHLPLNTIILKLPIFHLPLCGRWHVCVLVCGTVSLSLSLFRLKKFHQIFGILIGLFQTRNSSHHHATIYARSSLEKRMCEKQTVHIQIWCTRDTHDSDPMSCELCVAELSVFCLFMRTLYTKCVSICRTCVGFRFCVFVGLFLSLGPNY